MKVAVIPARGGSKRIPRKNIRAFGGKPMIAYSIDAAMRSGVFDRVMVSTDDPEIAEVAGRHGAEVPFMRPEQLSGDHTGTTEVIAHAISWLRAHGPQPTAVCCIYATAPFVHTGDLRKGLEILDNGPWRYVFSATTFAFPIFRAFRQRPGGGVEMFHPDHFETRSQDLPEAMHDAGQFYWGRPQAWVDGLKIFGLASTIVRIPRWRVQDIDTPEDWERAELMHRLLQNEDHRLPGAHDEPQ